MKNLFKKNFFWLILLFPFFNPTSFKYIPKLEVVYELIQVYKLIVVFFIIVIYFLGRRITLPVIFVGIMSIVLIGTSLANGIQETKIYTEFLLAISISMLTELAIRTEFEKFIEVFLWLTVCLFTINCIFCIIYPQGLEFASLYTNNANPLYLLATDNAMIKVLMPLIFVTYYIKFCDSEKVIIKSKRAANYLVVYVNLVCIITLLIVSSASGFAVYLIITAMFFVYLGLSNRKCPYKTLILGLVIVCLFMVLGVETKMFDVFTSFLGRTSDFTGRTLLWERALDLVKAHPIKGYGYSTGIIPAWGKTFSSHNMYLEILLQGGIFYLGVYIVLLGYAFFRNNKATKQHANVIFIALFAYLIYGLVEVGIDQWSYMLLTLACYPDLKSKKMVCFKI